MLGNEKSTDGQSEEAETDTVLHPKTAAQNSEAPTNAKKPKKKKKKAGDGKDTQQKGIKSTAEETSKQETTELVSTCILLQLSMYTIIFKDCIYR